MGPQYGASGLLEDRSIISDGGGLMNLGPVRAGNVSVAEDEIDVC